ncbi:hypothetical protein ONZ51_g1024 [Trametes cubensis]|uniref:Uncharacterized protein n=1 Tax=Trametes cubensis TaxID=1111947 RepID=A0AAD7XDF9_9APHY|nr:hypothetical protein ONZ51_g1024 [Trametes cubensis]
MTFPRGAPAANGLPPATAPPTARLSHRPPAPYTSSASANVQDIDHCSEDQPSRRPVSYLYRPIFILLQRLD